MQRIFLGVLAGAVGTKVFTVIKALIDFVYYAQLQSHTTRTLDAMQTAFNNFHAHKQVFVDLEIREHFNIHKIHAMQHYVDGIRCLGSTDGLPRAAGASSRRDIQSKWRRGFSGKKLLLCAGLTSSGLQTKAHKPLTTPALTLKTMMRHAHWCPIVVRLPRTTLPTASYKIAKSPSVENITVGHLHTAYGATNLVPTLTAFLKLRF
ncbi:hypothetical protein K438DRAFT_1771796 [Mycena galopus ATCC 62051]|nr:hypothetical protein K438DRAFT_1771796 [Mycena galopus ATCC 62051]